LDLGDVPLAAGALAAAGWLGNRAWRLVGRELWQVTRTALEDCMVVKRERARRDRIVAVVAEASHARRRRSCHVAILDRNND
jgi:hypothetical protein